MPVKDAMRRKALTDHKAEILARIGQEMVRAPVLGVITAIYPWKACKENMKSDKVQVKKCQML